MAGIESEYPAEANRRSNAFGEFEAATRAVSPCESEVDTVGGGTEPSVVVQTNQVAELRSLLGDSAILLPIPRGQKRPVIGGWQHTTSEEMNTPEYLQQLGAGNIGVLLGEASGDLCAIDIEDDGLVEPFITLNPALAGSPRTKGKRGCQIWVRIEGGYPKLAKLKTTDGQDWVEWRAASCKWLGSNGTKWRWLYAKASNPAPAWSSPTNRSRITGESRWCCWGAADTAGQRDLF